MTQETVALVVRGVAYVYWRWQRPRSDPYSGLGPVQNAVERRLRD